MTWKNLIFICHLLLQCVNLTGSKKCHSLSFDGLVSCENSKSPPTAPNDCRGSQSVGTMGKYSCKPHYVLRNAETGVPLKSGNNDVVTCGENGRWVGYERFKSAICQEECGRRLTNPKPLIVNGKPTNSTTWPWHVALFQRRNSEFDYICGGTIISRSTILTAAHCVTNVGGEKLLPNSTLVIPGAITSNLTENSLGIDAQIIEVKEIYVSQNFDVKKEFQADIAILHLSKHIEYTDHVSPICLPNDFVVDTNAIRPGTLGDVVGFGIDENGLISHNLKHGVLEIKSHTECFISLDRILSESQFCAGSPRDDTRVTVCNGDSGGGLIRPFLIDQKYYIHGIVSTGDSNPMERICTSHAVFTRVYTFIFWIHEILKEIKDNVLHLGSENVFLHRQSGTEEERGQFLSINQEWKNKVTAIELSYMDVDPEILLKSLDYSKTLKSINFTNVMFTRQIPRQRLFLPLLKTFSLDILRPDFDLTEERRFPITLTKEFLRSLLFFEKDVEHGNPDIARIESLKTNVDITVHIFKLLKIHHEQGNVVLSQIPFSNNILANISPDFRLKNLALSRTRVSPSFLSNGLLRKLENLVLDEVSGIQAHGLFENLKNLSALNEFVFISPKSESKFQIPWNSLPKSLKHLALTRAVIRVSTETYTSAISFPDHISKIRDSLRTPLNDLGTFYCDSCLSDDFSNSVNVLNRIFPNLRRLILKIDDTNINNTLIPEFQNFKKLEFALVRSPGSLNLYTKKNANWQVKSLKNSDTFFHFEFVFNRKDNFWSSEVDYIVGKRVTSFERLGFKSRHYRFNGGFNERRNFPAIPRQIQERLHTIQISNTEFSNKDLEDSMRYAKDVQSLRFTNLSFSGSSLGQLVELPKLKEYVLEHERIPSIDLFHYKTAATILSNLFPNSIPFREKNDIDIKRYFLFSTVNKYHMTYGNCVLLSWNKMEGRLVSGLSHTNEWLKHSNNTSIHIKNLVFQYWELDPAVVPSTISQLNLNFAIIKDMGILLHRLRGLKSLKLINVRANDEGNLKVWDWIQIDMEDFSKQSDALEYLAIERAHIRNYSPGMKFDKVEFVYLESCTFEKEFVKNFMTTFPKLKRLVIVGGNDPRIQIYLDVIILGALRSNTVNWILMSKLISSGSSSNRAREEINVILQNIVIQEKEEYSKYYIFERSTNSEPWNRNSNNSLDESNIESKLLEMKGVAEIGIDPRCHVSTFQVETKAAEPGDQLFSEIFEAYLSTGRYTLNKEV